MTCEELAIAKEETTLELYERFRADMRAQGKLHPSWSEALEEVRAAFRRAIGDSYEKWNERN